MIRGADKVFAIISKIPRGEVMTYGQVAKLAGGVSPRLVGKILHQNTDPENIPCHRVVRRDGSLAVRFKFGGMAAQEKKLREEGVIIAGFKVIK